MEIKIKNKFYNSRNLKKIRKFNAKYQKKRNKYNDCEPNNENYIFKAKPFEFDYELKNGEFFHFNGISHIIYAGSKIKINDFYNEILKVVKSNPRDNSFLSTIFNNVFKSEFLKGTGSNNFGYTECGEFSPNNNDLKEIVEQINIRLSSLSDESYFVDFVIIYKNEFNNYLNNMLSRKYEPEVRYSKNFVNGKKSVSCSFPFQYKLRVEKVDNILFEIKDRIVNFIDDNFDCFYESKSPHLSIEEYRTNLKYNDGFIIGFGFFISELMLQRLSEINCGDIKVNYYLEDKDNYFTSNHDYELNRRRLIFFTPKDEKIGFCNNFDYEIYKVILETALSKLQLLIDEKNVLLNDISSHIRCISLSKYYSRYCSLKIRENNILEILKSNKIQTMKMIYNDKNFTSYLKFIADETNRLEREKENLDTSVDSLLTLKTNKTSLIVSSIASICGFATIILTIVLKLLDKQ